ncbi:MAG: prephenate dehydratase [Myxococcota bacterium]
MKVSWVEVPFARLRGEGASGKARYLARVKASMPRKSSISSLPNEVASNQLDGLRSQIDEVDRALLERLNQRAKLVMEVGRIKESSGASVYEEAREQRIVKGLIEINPGPFPDVGLGPVFREIISATRSLEQGVVIAYMGPEGTFSHLAANQKFGRMAGLTAVATISDVFSAVERGEADLGIVPVENTTEGVVTQTLDTFVDCDISICGEVLLRIANDLASKSGRVEDVKQVASHPQALAQCRGWLDRNLPGIDRIEAASTTAAALLAVEDGALAAICSSVAAEKNGLAVIRESIQDRIDNTTRFLVIGRQAPRPTGNDLTSAVFTIRKDEPGGLYRLLQPFAADGINLTSIHLRPIKGKPWEYLFFLDLEGHRSDERVANALASVASIAHSHRVLGSFPRAELAGAGRTAWRDQGD